MGGADSAAKSGHVTIAIVGVPILVQSRGLNVAIVVTVVTPYIHCVVLGVL